jgi:phenylacetic acid degradation operon negative regulatory protein
LGFGRLAPGTWISPHNRQIELQNLFSDLEVEEFVEQFSAVHFGPSSNQDLANGCWDLSELEIQYKEFIDLYQPDFEEHRKQLKKKMCPTLKDCFIQQFWITHEFQAMPLKDPNLPTTLLPSDWVGFTARKLLDQYRDLLRPKALQFVKEVISGDGQPPTDQN